MEQSDNYTTEDLITSAQVRRYSNTYALVFNDIPLSYVGKPIYVFEVEWNNQRVVIERPRSGEKISISETTRRTKAGLKMYVFLRIPRVALRRYRNFFEEAYRLNATLKVRIVFYQRYP